VIDSEQDLTTPVAHHRVSGHFEGTAIKFTIYLPPAVQWKGRFFQYTHPLSDENALDRVVAFGPPAEGQRSGQRHAGVRAQRRRCEVRREVAAAYYGSGSRRIYGYFYSPSGGSFQTVGAIENRHRCMGGCSPDRSGRAHLFNASQTKYKVEVQAFPPIMTRYRSSSATRPGSQPWLTAAGREVL
jgi:hypothetical protein